MQFKSVPKWQAFVQAAKPPKFTPEEISAQEEEEVRRQLPKMPRPTMADRAEDFISLNLSRSGRELQASASAFFPRKQGRQVSRL